MSASMLEVRHLRLVRAIAEEGGVTRAAARLHLTQSAVSHQLAELEGRLGILLFSRVRRQLTLTRAGSSLLDGARRLLSELDDLERGLQRRSTETRQSIRLTIETFTSYHWLPAVVAKLRKEHPLVDLKVALGARHDPVAALLRGEIELCMVSSPVQDRNLSVVPIGEDEWTVILAPEHPLARRRFMTASELGQQIVFAHDSPRSDVERLRDIAEADRTPLPRVEIVPLTDVLVEFVRARLGVGLVSRWAVGPYLSRGDVVSCRFTRLGLPERWSAAFRRDSRDRLPLGRVAELLRQHVGIPKIARSSARARRTSR